MQLQKCKYCLWWYHSDSWWVEAGCCNSYWTMPTTCFRISIRSVLQHPQGNLPLGATTEPTTLVKIHPYPPSFSPRLRYFFHTRHAAWQHTHRTTSLACFVYTCFTVWGQYQGSGSRIRVVPSLVIARYAMSILAAHSNVQFQCFSSAPTLTAQFGGVLHKHSHTGRSPPLDWWTWPATYLLQVPLCLQAPGPAGASLKTQAQNSSVHGLGRNNTSGNTYLTSIHSCWKKLTPSSGSWPTR